MWGSIAYVHILKKHHKRKLGKQAIKRQLTRIEGHRTYYVLVLETGQIIRSCNVKFEEVNNHYSIKSGAINNNNLTSVKLSNNNSVPTIYDNFFIADKPSTT